MKHLLHLSDFHFKGSSPLPLNADKLLRSIKNEISALEEPSNIHLCITGDIVFQNDKTGYPIAEAFIRSLCEQINIGMKRVIICPGNHDLSTKDSNFRAYNKFASDLTRNSQLLFENNDSCRSYIVDEIQYIIVNTLHHFVNKYGSIHLDSLREQLKNSSDNFTVLLMHHHLIPTGEFSCIKNAYNVICECLSRNVKLILHGHRHMNTNLQIGENSLKVIGAGTLFFNTETSGYTNQYQLISISEKTIDLTVYKYIVDSDKSKYFEGFVPERYSYDF